MSHIADAELTELASDMLPPDRRAAVQAHLVDCEPCRDRYGAVAQTWRLLGEWQAPERERDLAPAVVDAARREHAAPRAAGAWRRALPALRTAAAVLVSIGIGHAAGRLAARPATPAADRTPVAVGVVRPTEDDATSQTAAAARADAEAADESLSLDVFESGSPAGMAEALLGAHEPAEGKGT